MASFRGIEGACAGLVSLLEDAIGAGFPAAASVDLIEASSIEELTTGIGILPYRVTVNGTYRRPGGTLTSTGGRRLTKLPVDVSIVIVIVAESVAAKLALAGWTMRTLEDHPVLPHGLLNRDSSAAFDAGESVEITPEHVPHEELLHLWEVFGQTRFDPMMLPYALRNIGLETDLTLNEYAAVQERLLRFGSLTEGSQDETQEPVGATP